MAQEIESRPKWAKRWGRVTSLVRNTRKSNRPFQNLVTNRDAVFDPCPYSDELLIVFSSFFIKLPHKDFYSFRELLAKHRINKLFVRDTKNIWYRDGVAAFGNSLDSSIDYLKHEITGKFEVVRTMGASMGGYAAILYGHELGCDECIAVASQTFMKSGFPRYPKGRGGVYPDLADVITASNQKTRTEVFIGADDLFDLYNAARISQHPQVYVSEFRKTAHNLLSYWVEKDQLREFVASCSRGGIQTFRGRRAFLINPETRNLIITAIEAYFKEPTEAEVPLRELAQMYPTWPAPSATRR